MSKNNNKQEYEKINAEIQNLENDALELMELSERIPSGDVCEILDFNQSYTSLVKRIERTIDKVRKFDKLGNSDLWEKTGSLYDDINYIYDEASIQINSLIAQKTQEIEERIRNNQGVQLAVFSIVLSILAFVLTNARILTIDDISFKSVLLVNLSFMLSANILFSLIYLFMGPIFYSKKGRLRIFTFVILPILLIAAIVLVALFMK